MKAEILCVGTELLLGDIVNTNAAYLAQRLASLGISVYHQSVVGDNNEKLKKEFQRAFEYTDMIITTGGLGPTTDDLTKETASEYFNKRLVIHENSLKSLEAFFAKINRKMSDNNLKQAYFPEESVIFPNEHGTAPGCAIENEGKIIIVLPGPPKEMKPMFENYVVPYLKKFQDSVIVSKVLRLCGIGEGEMAEAISDIIENQINPTVAPYAKENDVTLRITAKASSEDEAFKLIEPVESSIRERLGENIYGINEDSMELVIGQMLINKGITISTAESCTGGLLAGMLVNYPGISQVFLEGAVTYSNEAKIKRLNVNPATLEKYGAVSKETAGEMALGIAKAAGTDIGLSTTGIAGPGGGTADKKVGLVYIGLYINGKTIVKKKEFSGDRQKVRNRSVIYALDLLRRELLKLNQ